MLLSSLALKDISGDDEHRALSLLHKGTMPLSYPSSFYKSLKSLPSWHCLAVNHNGKMVGAITSRVKLEKIKDEENKKGEFIEIETLAVLTAYRKKGIGSYLLESMLKKIEAEVKGVKIIVLMQESNEDLKRFYERFGFQVEKKIENYYTTLDSKNALQLIYEGES